MVNLLGDVWPEPEVHPDWSPILQHPRAKLHLYGKASARAKRKRASSGEAPPLRKGQRACEAEDGPFHRVGGRPEVGADHGQGDAGQVARGTV